MEFRPHQNSAFTFLSSKNYDKPSNQIRNNKCSETLNSGLFQKIPSVRGEFPQYVFNQYLKTNTLQPLGNDDAPKEICNLPEQDSQNSSGARSPHIPNNKRKLPYNDTKNIPKNFGKAIIAFAQKNQKPISRCLKKYDISYYDFISELKKKKRTLHSIKQLRAMWLDSQFPLAKPFRQVSLYFMNRSSLKYIFGSRVIDYSGHLKYRKRIINALKKPIDFYSIKHE